MAEVTLFDRLRRRRWIAPKAEEQRLRAAEVEARYAQELAHYPLPGSEMLVESTDEGLDAFLRRERPCGCHDGESCDWCERW